MNVLVVGSTGNQGRAVTRQLLQTQSPFDVHGLTRDPTTIHAQALRDLDVTTVAGNLNDPESFNSDLDEMDAVFGMTHSAAGYEREREHGIALADAAAEAGVDHFVFSSVIGADQATNTEYFDAKREIEQHLDSLDLPTTVLRPVWFMYNVEQSRRDIQEGTFAIPLENETAIQMLDANDYGRFVAAVFAAPDQYIGETINIAGDEHTLEEMARILARVVGETIEPTHIPIENSPGSEVAAIIRQSSRKRSAVDIAAFEERHDINFNTFERYLRDHDWNNL
jgi:uncharacterized protein YbjT (DUF2867 family)